MVREEPFYKQQTKTSYTILFITSCCKLCLLKERGIHWVQTIYFHSVPWGVIPMNDMAIL
jgi:hypothetical protein